MNSVRITRRMMLAGLGAASGLLAACGLDA